MSDTPFYVDDEPPSEPEELVGGDDPAADPEDYAPDPIIDVSAEAAEGDILEQRVEEHDLGDEEQMEENDA